MKTWIQSLCSESTEYCFDIQVQLKKKNICEKSKYWKKFWCTICIYNLTQIVFWFVKNSMESKLPSDPIPEFFIPPNGMFRSRTSQQLAHTVPTCRHLETRWSRDASWVHSVAANPYSTSLARRITSSSVSKGTIHVTGPKISSFINRESSFTSVITVGRM